MRCNQSGLIFSRKWVKSTLLDKWELWGPFKKREGEIGAGEVASKGHESC